MGNVKALKEQREIWERRAQDKKDSLPSVLFRGMPDWVNAYVHERHSDVVVNRFLPLVRDSGSVLDLGCGYGRIGQVMQDSRPDLRICGLDFSHAFCRYYTSRLKAPAVCADISLVPFALASFDALTSITSIMYAPRDQRETVVTRFMELLKPDGIALFIEPGEEFFRLAARFSPASANTPTGGLWFTMQEYDELGSSDRWQILGRGGFPAMSLALPVLWLLRSLRIPFDSTARLVTKIDRRMTHWRRFSVYRWMIVQRTR